MDLLIKVPLSSLTTFLPMGLPEAIRIPLRYSSKIAIDVDVDSDNLFALNGCYDPDITGTGHQPYYFDQLIGLYQRYRVIRTAVRFRYVPVATTNAGAALMVLYPTLDATTLEGTPINNVVDLQGAQNKVANGTGSQFAPEIATELDIARLTQTDKTASALYGSNSSNPSVLAYVHAFVATMDGTTALSGQGLFEMVQDVEFSRRRVVGPS